MPHPVTPNFWRRVKFYLKKCLQSPPFSFMAINWVKVSKNATSSHPKFLEKGQSLPQKMPHPVTPILIHGHKLGQSLKKCHIQTPNFWRRVKVYLKKCLQSPPFSFMAINWVKVSKNATSSHPKFLEKGQILPQKMPPVTTILIHGHKLGQSLKKCHIQTPNFWRRVKFYLKKCLQSPPFSFMAINWVKVSKNATSSHPKFLEKGQILPQKMPPVTPILIHGHKLGQSLKKCHIQTPNFWRRVKVYLKKCHIQSPPFSFMAINWVKVSKNATSKPQISGEGSNSTSKNASSHPHSHSWP